jgi:hypothetical protein
MFVLSRQDRDPDAASKELRKRHTEHLVTLWRAGVTMRTIRRHRLDDPRLTDEVRGILVDAAIKQQSKARFRRSVEQRKQDRMRMLLELGPFVGTATTIPPTSDSPERSPAATKVVDPLSVQGAIQSIRQHVCEHFYLREGLPHPMEGRRPRHPHPQTSQGGVREFAVVDCDFDSTNKLRTQAILQ